MTLKNLEYYSMKNTDIRYYSPDEFKNQVSNFSETSYLVYLRSLFPYEYVKEIISKNSSVLEVGFGEGYGIHHISQKVKMSVGLELSETYVEYAKKKYLNSSCNYMRYDGEKIPFENNTFDYVISCMVIEHVLDIYSYLKEMYRVLKPGGYLYLTTPNRKLRLKDNEKPFNRFHITEFDQESLFLIISRVFDNITIYGIDGTPDIHNLELKRIHQLRQFNKWDIFSISKRLPEPLVYKTLKILRYFLNFLKKKSDYNFFERYSLNDFFITTDNVDNAIDLFAFCKKGLK